MDEICDPNSDIRQNRIQDLGNGDHKNVFGYLDKVMDGARIRRPGSSDPGGVDGEVLWLRNAVRDAVITQGLAPELTQDELDFLGVTFPTADNPS